MLFKYAICNMYGINIVFIIFREEYFKTDQLRWMHQKTTYQTGKRCPAYPSRYPVESPRSNCCCLCLARYIIKFVIELSIFHQLCYRTRKLIFETADGVSSVHYLGTVQYLCDYVGVHDIFTYLYSGGSRSLKPWVGATLKHLSDQFEALVKAQGAMLLKSYIMISDKITLGIL